MKSKNAVVGTKVVHKGDGREGVIIEQEVSGMKNLVRVEWADSGEHWLAVASRLKKAEKVK